MARKLFGTDGVRGVAGEFLTAELALALGAGRDAPDTGAARPQVLIVRDTRESGEMLQAAVAAGVSAAGRRRAARRRAADPRRAAADRALRLRPGGRAVGLAQPLPRTTASSSSRATATSSPTRPSWQIEQAALERAAARARSPRRSGASASCAAPPRTTCASCTRASPALDLTGWTWLLDCANGATYHVAPEIFRRLGANVTVIADEPDGRNINDGLRLHAHRGARRAGRRRAATRIGFAFDGDGDRVLAVDRRGEVVDGDELMALAALHLRDSGRLAGNGVAVTVMTNYGFHSAMERAGVEVAHHAASATATCWRSCARAAGRSAASSRGTSSRWASTAPATASPARCSRSRRSAGRDLSERDAMPSCPSGWSTCACATAARSQRAQGVDAAVQRRRARAAGRGRVLVRASGTEPLVRVMVEAPTERGGRGGLRTAGRARASASWAESAGAVAGPGRRDGPALVSSRRVCGIVGYVGRRGPSQELLLARPDASSSTAAMTRPASP